MKTTFLKSTLTLAFIATMLTSCVKDEDYATPKLTDCADDTMVATKLVSEIPATAIVTEYTRDEVIEAYVTSSDIAGNFFKSISFETKDKTRAFSVPMDVTSTFIDFEPGRKVYIKMKGLYTDVKYGGMRIGSLYGNSTGGAEVGRLTSDQVKATLFKSCTVVSEDELAQTVTIDQAMDDSYLNKLIDIEDVQFTDEDLNKPYYDPNNDIGGATNHHLMDIKGNSVIFRFSSYANFSAKTLPSGNGTVRGIMTKYGSDYQFVVRTESDIDFTNPRSIVTVMNESFLLNFPNWIKKSVLGNEVWTIDAIYGNPDSCAKMNGYSGGNKLNEDWLISPVMNLSGLTQAYLSFQTATNYNGTVLTAFVSNNYNGTGLPSTATWTPVTATFAPNNPASGSGFTWTNSGSVDLTSVTGTGNNAVYVAFKYISTTAAASTWEVDNVKITGK